jgi:hypothetical protein
MPITYHYEDLVAKSYNSIWDGDKGEMELNRIKYSEINSIKICEIEFKKKRWHWTGLVKKYYYFQYHFLDDNWELINFNGGYQ